MLYYRRGGDIIELHYLLVISFAKKLRKPFFMQTVSFYKTMSFYKKFLSSKYSLVLFFIGGLLFAGGLSVWATSIGTNVSVSGTLTVSGNSTMNGNSTLGDAATDINLFTGTLQASTTALFTSGFTTYGNWIIDKLATTTVTFNQAGINFGSGTLVIDPNASRVGLGTTSPISVLSVQGDTLTSGTSTVGAVIATSTLLVGGTTGTTLSAVNAGVGVASTSPGTRFSIHDVANFRIGTSTLYSAPTFPNFAATSTATSTINYGIRLSDVGGSVGIATTTAARTLSVGGDGLFGGAATTSVAITSTTATVGGCIQLKATDGTMVRIYATTTPNTTALYTNGGLALGYQNLVVEAGVCRP